MFYGVPISKNHLTVPIIERVKCLWCGRVIRERIIALRIKESSHDTPTRIYKTDYHEGCWAVAIEVVI
ncbi:hypothetical protein LCGC14_0621930 [marine sediment metagenome]|uniref:Uncharacterized protein n=1 Tax=marine sediment metagenome TaxID=412755 RepID=A0A0F9TQW4_9ZZZZ